MSLITVSNLTFAYQGSYDNIFENVSFQLDTDWKLGFTGRNGRGKTTFLNLLRGKYPYQGSITSSVGFDYFPFAVPDLSALTADAAQQIEPSLALWQLRRELNLLEADADGLLYRPFETLSKGEQTKVLLALLFTRQNRYLLIDEPTNHLDLDARRAVGAYLARKPGFLLVSHDRAVLDACTDHTLSINRTNIEIQRGSYSVWEQNKRLRDAAEAAENDRLKRDISRLTEAARRTAAWASDVEKSKKGVRAAGLRPDRGHIGHMAAKMDRRTKAVADRRQKAVEEKSRLLRNVETAEDLKLRPLTHHASRLVEASKLSVCYSGCPVFQDVSFSIEPGERVCLAGRNGSGKSSILKLILGEPVPHTGALNLASGLVCSYVSQDTSFLQGSLSNIAQDAGIDETLFLAILRKLDFERVQFEKQAQTFSEGQKKKVLIARSLCQRAHLYVWDEPLNFVDVLSREQLERLLAACAPTMLFVEHDSRFAQAVATKFIELRPPSVFPRQD